MSLDNSSEQGCLPRNGGMSKGWFPASAFMFHFSRGLSHPWGFLSAQLLHAGNNLLKIPVMDTRRSENY